MNESSLLSIFSTFGDISDVQLPRQTDQGAWPTSLIQRVITVNLAKAQKVVSNDSRRPIWETDVSIHMLNTRQAWLQEHNTAAQDADPQAGWYK